ncbi:YdeI/OmpD-associated family protein [Candidatus Leptofilum sp.]|uniref:YdeI/OmpD-associated family protein n=1 Tax=Candidatus Leptofilum sp. TaxID=3241576 RepID=UPI003B5C8A0D
MSQEKEKVQVETRAELRGWLAQNHPRQGGVWLVTFKKHCGDKYVSYDDIVEELICFGWIDSMTRKLDADRSMLWIAPRKRGSNWSRRNKEIVARLEATGLLAPPGLAKIEAAKADGTWDALNAVENLEIPPDLAEALAQYPDAAAYFEAFPRSVKRGILEWIFNAKRPQTRAKRIEETARLAQDNLRANQWPRQG